MTSQDEENAINSNASPGAALQDHAGLSMNDSGTRREIGTPLTQWRSGSDLVLVPSLHSVNFALENARRYFIAQRVREGASTPIGRRWSNLVELFQNYFKAENSEQLDNIKISIAKNVLDIRELRRGRPPVLLNKPQLLLAYQSSAFQ